MLRVTLPQEAHAVREQVNGFKLDKSHTFAVNMFDEIERYMRVPDAYEPPEEKAFQPSVRSLFWPLSPQEQPCTCLCRVLEAGMGRGFLGGISQTLALSATFSTFRNHYFASLPACPKQQS